jgi:hypothetical protein
MPKNRNTNACTAFYVKARKIVKSNRFGRFYSMNGFADICIGNRGKGYKFRRLRERGKVHRAIIIINRSKMLSESVGNCTGLD